eukprot:m.198984 g.198984  ORF g.198984 m.198984 type:complete len:61 (-) comp32715_c0_seq5:207-389(-)
MLSAWKKTISPTVPQPKLTSGAGISTPTTLALAALTILAADTNSNAINSMLTFVWCRNIM